MVKKIIKGYFFAILIFVMLTLFSAVLMRLTSLSETVNFYLLIVSMCMACLIFGIIAGNTIKKKGLFTGIAAAIVMLTGIIAISVLCFQAQISTELFKIIYIIPVAVGAAGGIWGTNLSKA